MKTTVNTWTCIALSAIGLAAAFTAQAAPEAGVTPAQRYRAAQDGAVSVKLHMTPLSTQ